MKLHHIKEPKLDFGTGTHVCPRAGITEHDVYDARFDVRREKIHVGAVGRTDDLEKLTQWLHRCSQPIPGKLNSNKPNLFPPFCGFSKDSGFRSELVINKEITRYLRQGDINRVIKAKNWGDKIEAATNLYYRQIKFLAQNRPVDVIVCILPSELYNAVAIQSASPVEETIGDDEQDDYLESNFRRALKAKSMHLGKPLQLLRELSLESNPQSQQDDATKAWNFCTALYYKASQTVPWRLVADVNKPSVCFVGIGFYRSRDRQVLETSLAQVFDELGNSVILRGTPVEIDKNDRRPHLTEEQAFQLLQRALNEYEIAMSTMPARLVIHKSSNYDVAEKEGFKAAAEDLRINTTDLVTILDTDYRLVRKGNYPPYRGTQIELTDDTHLLYTRGSVEYYETYPGKYIPQPLEIRIVESDESPGLICREILALTKMNWNNTQFDGKYPITIECARRVGKIMKYLGEDDKPQISYSFYM